MGRGRRRRRGGRKTVLASSIPSVISILGGGERACMKLIAQIVHTYDVTYYYYYYCNMAVYYGKISCHRKNTLVSPVGGGEEEGEGKEKEDLARHLHIRRERELV